MGGEGEEGQRTWNGQGFRVYSLVRSSGIEIRIAHVSRSGLVRGSSQLQM